MNHHASNQADPLDVHELAEMSPRERAERAARFAKKDGTCQACGRRQAVRDDLLAKHGYTVAGGS